MVASVGGLIADIGLDVAGLRQDIKQSNKELARGTSRMNRHLGSMRKKVDSVARGFKGLAAAVSVALLARVAKDAIDSADKMLKLTQRLGGTTEAFSELEFVAERSGIAFNTLTMGLQRMVRRVAEAAEGFGEAKGALKELRLDAQELRKLPLDQQFERVADALAGLGSDADRVRLAMKLFDSEGVALLQTMTNGAAGIRDLREEAKKLGVTLSTDMAEKAVDAKDAMTNLSAVWSVFTRNLSIDAIPVVSGMVEKLNDLREVVRTIAEIAAGGTGLGAQADVLEKQIDALAAERLRISAQIEGLSRPGATRGGLLGELASKLRNDPSISELQSRLSAINEELSRLKAQQLDVQTQLPAKSEDIGRKAGETAGANFVSGFRAEVDIGGPLSADTLIPDLSADQIFPTSSIVEGAFVEIEDAAEDTAETIGQSFDSLATGIGFSLQRSFSDAFMGVETNFGDLLRRLAADFASSTLLKGLASLIPGSFGKALSSSLPGFAHGGSFTVGGGGSTDSELVAFNATPGERVTITPRGKSAGGSITVINHIDARGEGEARIMRVLPPLLEQTKNATIAEIITRQREGRI